MRRQVWKSPTPRPSAEFVCTSHKDNFNCVRAHVPLTSSRKCLVCLACRFISVSALCHLGASSSSAPSRGTLGACQCRFRNVSMRTRRALSFAKWLLTWDRHLHLLKPNHLNYTFYPMCMIRPDFTRKLYFGIKIMIHTCHICCRPRSTLNIAPLWATTM